MVALVSAWHECHYGTSQGVRHRLDQGWKWVVAAPTLSETYSVLTRLPAPYRIEPAFALGLLQGNFKTRFAVGLAAREYWQVLEALASDAQGGGLVYDALILACARKARAAELLTLNDRDFSRLGPSDVRVVNPLKPILS